MKEQLRDPLRKLGDGVQEKAEYTTEARLRVGQVVFFSISFSGVPGFWAN